jgi:hypothetical protein
MGSFLADLDVVGLPEGRVRMSAGPTHTSPPRDLAAW